MIDKKEFNATDESIRKIIGAVVRDLVEHISSSDQPIVVGGQYPNARLLNAVNVWAYDRKLNLNHPDRAGEIWLNLCSQGFLAGDKKFDKPLESTTPPPPEPPPKPPKPKPEPPSGHQYRDYKDGDQNDTPAGSLDGDDANGWKPEDQKKDRWQDEGEDWKKGSDDDKA